MGGEIAEGPIVVGIATDSAQRSQLRWVYGI